MCESGGRGDERCNAVGADDATDVEERCDLAFDFGHAENEFRADAHTEIGDGFDGVGAERGDLFDGVDDQADLDDIAENLRRYLQAFPSLVRDIFEHFDLDTQTDRLSRAKLLDLVAERSTKVDLHPDVVSNAQLGTVFEDLNRKFAEASNATADEHFLPRSDPPHVHRGRRCAAETRSGSQRLRSKGRYGRNTQMVQGHLADLRRNLGSVESVETRPVKPGPDTVSSIGAVTPSENSYFPERTLKSNNQAFINLALRLRMIERPSFTLSSISANAVFLFRKLLTV